MNIYRPVKLTRDGGHQSVRIPPEFELPGDDAVMHKEGDRLIIEFKKDQSPKNILELIEWLKAQPPLGPDDEFPDIEDFPPDPVYL